MEWYVPLEKRGERREREGFSGTRSREGTSETWTALRAMLGEREKEKERDFGNGGLGL